MTYRFFVNGKEIEPTKDNRKIVTDAFCEAFNVKRRVNNDKDTKAS